MRYLSRLMALLCAMVMLAAPCLAQDIDDYTATLQATLEAAQALTDEFLAISDLEMMYNRMYAVVQSETESPLLNALSSDQVKAISDHANELYLAIENRSALDYETLEMTIEMLTVARKGSQAVVYAPPSNAIYFDISYGDVQFTKEDLKYTGYNSNGTKITGNHVASNVYVISGTTDKYGVSIGSYVKDGNAVFCGSSYNIYLNNVTIKRKEAGNCAFFVAHSGGNKVNLILANGTKNTLYSGRGRAGLEKSHNQGELIITCEAGYANGTGHKCNSTCGALDARSGNAWTNTGLDTFNAGAGIGSQGGKQALTTEPAEGEGIDYSRVWNLTIQGGNITAMGGYGHASSGANDYSGGGAAIGTGSAWSADTMGGTVKNLKITGGIIKAYRSDNSAACIGGGYRSDTVEMSISGGVIYAGGEYITSTGKFDRKYDIVVNSEYGSHLRAPSIGAGGGGTNSGSPAGATVNISGGTIHAYGEYGAAIGGGGGGASGQAQAATVNISGGTVYAVTDEGYGAAIGTGGSYGNGRGGDATVTIKGSPTIIANSAKGADIGGGGTNGTGYTNYGGKGTVTISGGTITALKGGIGGGQANMANGGDAEVTISGANTVINAVSIGGGDSAQAYGGNCIVTINNGTITVNNQKGASIGGGTGMTKGGDATVAIHGGTLKTGSIGGGLAGAGKPIGSAQATITGGSIQGQVVMAAGADQPCSFDMSGGTIDNSNSSSFYFIRDKGGAVYVENGTAKLTGGTIKNCGTNQSSNKNGNFDYGGAIYVIGGDFIMTGGMLESNTAGEDGGAVYVTEGTVTIGTKDCTSEFHPTLKNNHAKNGGAVAVAGSTPTMYCGTFNGNSATVNGGAVYVTGGGFEIHDGSVTQNSAENGGAIYLAGGNFTMYHGNVDNNSATKGGAVYVVGDANTEFVMQSGTMSNNSASDDGGAVYATSGTLKIGLENCLGSERVEKEDGTVEILDGRNEKHEAIAPGRHHPKMVDNTASDCGGGITIEGEGVVHLYCCNIVDNTALYPGVGNNVFMKGGVCNYYDGTNVGLPRKPDLVIIGGTLNNCCETEDYVTLMYYADNKNANEPMTGLAQNKMWMTMPSGEYFFTPPDGYRFFGWTPKGYESGDFVRNTGEYIPSGTNVQIIDEAKNTEDENQGTFDGKADKTMHLYALWAPKVSYITYVDLTKEDDPATTEDERIIAHEPASYEFNEATNTIEIKPIAAKPGYGVVGWYLYQDEGQNANWGYEPKYLEGTTEAQKDYATLDLENFPEDQYLGLKKADASYTLDAGHMRFGNITLIANFAPQFGNLKITKALAENVTLDDNASFVFNISGTSDSGKNVNMNVTVNGTSTVEVVEIPVGKYKVQETAWSWRNHVDSIRLEIDGDEEETVTTNFYSNVPISNPEGTVELIFTNSRPDIYWLDGEAEAKENHFN